MYLMLLTYIQTNKRQYISISRTINSIYEIKRLYIKQILNLKKQVLKLQTEFRKENPKSSQYMEIISRTKVFSFFLFVRKIRKRS